MARLFADENFPFPVVQALREKGHDVRTLQESGQGGMAVRDEDVLRTATAEGRAVLTLNRKDFLRLHRATPDHAGIVVCTFDPDFDRQASRIDAALAGVDPRGQVVRVNRPG
jgi:predicted nuclease of predicted toxin-antitoxin system